MASPHLISESDGFFETLAASRHRALLVDYDGTLAPFRQEPQHAFPYPGVMELLDSIRSTTATRLVLVTGRPAAKLLPLLGLHPAPEIFGVHGLERFLPDGSRRVHALEPEAVLALAEAGAELARAGVGALVEHKLGAVAVHWRGLPERSQAQAESAARKVLQRYARNGLILAPFDHGLELRLARPNKGDAVRTIFAEAPAAAAAYLGDDLTDEDAFEAIHGRGLGVLVAKIRRRSAATEWLQPPEGLMQFLHRWLHVCGGDA